MQPTWRQHHRADKHRTAAFVAASLAAHATLALWPADSPRSTDTAPGVMNVSLRTEPAARPSTTAIKKAEHPQQPRQALQPPRPADHVVPSRAGASAPPPSAAHGPAVTAAPAPSAGTVLAEAAAQTQAMAVAVDNPPSISVSRSVDPSLLAGEIKRRMDAHKVFPYLARMRGWQGRVLLAFRVDHRGNIDNIEVAQGSGYSLLDHSAIQALRAIGSLSDAERYLPADSVQLELPVIYRLIEG